jgi:hypothetical protein
MEWDLYSGAVIGSVTCLFLGLMFLDRGGRKRALLLFVCSFVLALFGMSTVFVWPYFVIDQVKAIIAGLLIGFSILFAVCVFLALKVGLTSLHE